ncbi:hypothetical protein KIL84_009840 [Mauremys mutica]|uniref:PLA2c domain-containing protein n=1 Tax=Mauremys mutica TaxID=74926 RepID=A0A9D4B663_9SAUR|nr:hypothetical protein KIL84_009840 [Mauremys mutica]
MLSKLDKGHLSEQQSSSENGNNPYPIYAAVDERSFSKVTEYSPATWFEFTPHEASFLGYGASVPMEYFGSEYKNGELKKQKEEKNMSYLQGLWGSAIGSKTENERVIKDTKNKSTTENIKGGVAAFDSAELVKDKVISLVDAGIAINCAFPLVLRPERKVRLILSFDYGSFEPFKTLKQTAKYCKENCIPFPEIDEKLLQEPDNPSDCYIFRGDGAPTVMHFPLFNRVNCPAYVTEWRIRFTMLRFLYHVGDITKLLQSARLNVLNNKDKILQEIKYIVAHSSKEASS